MKRPTIKTPCVADRYHGSHERIAEVFGPESQAGCLISAAERQDDEGRWYLDVEVYRTDNHDVHARVRIEGAR